MEEGNLLDLFDLLATVPWYVWVVAFLVLYLLLIRRYRRLAGEAVEWPAIAPVSVQGAIAEELERTTGKVGGALKNQLANIAETFRGLRGKQVWSTRALIGSEFGKMMELASASVNLNPSEHPSNFRLEKDVRELSSGLLKARGVDVGGDALFNILLWLVQQVPAPERKRYLASRIYTSLSSDAEKKLSVRVCRDSRYAGASSGDKAEGPDRPESAPLTDKVRRDQGTDLLRNAAFMILQLHGRAFPELYWESLRYFTDGLNQLARYRTGMEPGAYNEAKKCFKLAIDKDKYNNNYEARCFLASMLVTERKEGSIEDAIFHFTHALNTDRPNFKAFVHAGLAHCYVQQRHRLAEYHPDVLANAREHAKKAAESWEGADPHPWIVYTQALVQVIDEGGEQTPDDVKNQFIPAIKMCLKAIKGEEGNLLFHNGLGWMLLKLTERGVQELKPEDKVPDEVSGNTAETAERYLRHSRGLSKNNKLSRANLCLLYATEHFRKKDPDKYLDDCRDCGLEAVAIDPGYINGYRDLAVSLLRYRHFDEAYGYFEEALRLAVKRAKDDEIIGDALKVLDGMKDVGEDEKRRWRDPDPKLREPPRRQARRLIA
jgi:tetratricopeptide (TPR) repeat protein